MMILAELAGKKLKLASLEDANKLMEIFERAVVVEYSFSTNGYVKETDGYTPAVKLALCSGEVTEKLPPGTPDPRD